MPTQPPILNQAVPVLRRALAEFRALPPAERTETPDEADAHIAQALGLALERLGNVKGALAVYNDAITRNPRDGELIVARGLALYGIDLQAAAPLRGPYDGRTYGCRFYLALPVPRQTCPPSRRLRAGATNGSGC